MFTFRQSSEFLDPISFFLLFISNLFFCMVILKQWKARISNILLPLIYPILCTASVIFVGKIANEPTAYIALFIFSMLSLLILLKVSLEESILLSTFQIFHMIFAKSIVAGAMSLILQKNMYQLFQVAQYEQLIMAIAHGVLVVLFFIYYLTFNKKKISTFFLCKGQVYNVMITHIIISIYMLFKSYNFYFNLDLIWFSVEQIFTAIILYSLFMISFKFSVLISNLMQNQIRLKNQNYKILCEAANFEAFSEELKEDSNISKSKILNAFFAEFKNICKFENIKLNIEGHIPENINISENELHEMLSSALKNSIEASLKITNKNDRKIDIKFFEENKNFKIEIKNIYAKKPNFNNGIIQSSKSNIELEGLGIGYIKQVLNKNKGKIGYKVDVNNKTFILNLILNLK